MKKEKTNATSSKTQFAETGSGAIAYRMIGEGDPIILCPRFRGNLDCWDPAFLDALAKKHKVVTFNYRGFGSSTRKPASTMIDFGSDVMDLAATLGIERFILCGWSFGGGVAQTIAMEHPDIISHLILIGTRPPGKPLHDTEPLFYDIAWTPNNTLEHEEILFFEPAWEASRAAALRSHNRIAARMKDPDMFIPPLLWDHYVKGFQSFAEDRPNTLSKMKETTMPVLVISSDHEICFPPENWFALNRQLPTTQVIVIPKTGHGVHHEYPKLISKYMTSFIKNFNSDDSN